MKSYHFDSKANTYTVFGKDGEDIVTSTDQHKNILIDYTVRKMPIQQICLKHKMSVGHFDEYRRAFGLTRDSLPISDEEILNNPDTRELGLTLLERVDNVVSQAKDQEEQVLREKAQKWNDFEKGSLNPFHNALKTWKPDRIKPPKGGKKVKNNRWFCVGFSDWHIGLGAEERYLFRGERDWNTEEAKMSVRRLAEDIKTDVLNDKVGFEGCVLVLGGDMLHGPHGTTAKGTQVETETYGEAQFDALLELLYEVIGQFAGIFNKVIVHTVRGNHEGLHHYSSMLALQNYFRNDKRIEVNIHSKRTATFKIANTMILLDHGSSDEYKRAHVPKAGTARESYILSLILSKSDLYSSCNGCIFLQGDKHHYEQTEFNDFEFIMMGALPLGDKYSDNHNWNSRARQNCFVIDDQGLKSVMHYYIR